MDAAGQTRPADDAHLDDVHLIVAEDAEVTIEYHPEDWLAIVLFWALAIIVFLQFFTRYVLNDSFAWTEEVARYGLIWVTFIGGAMVTRRRAHIAVELMSNLMKPGLARATILAFVDIVTFAFLGLLAWFSFAIYERMQYQRMTVFDLPMSYVYAGVLIGCVLMFVRQGQVLIRHARERWSRPDDITHQIAAD